jgi:hypothetical protein
LIENQDEFQESFMKVPYSKTLLRLDSLEVARLSQESKPDLEEGLATTDENLQNLKNSFKTSIDTLKTRRLNPLMNFNTKCHQPGKDIFGRLAKLDERLHKLSNDGNAFGSMQFLGGFGSGVPLEADSLTWFKALEDRLSRLDTKNTTLRSKIGNLEGQGEVSKPDSSEKANMEPLLERISTLEGNQSGEVVTMGGVSISGPMDCKVFLKTSVPENILSAFCYDMISLTHRAEGELSTEAILSRDHNAKKGGFPNWEAPSSTPPCSKQFRLHYRREVGQIHYQFRL